MAKNISQNGIDFIASFEGCRLSAYDDLQPNVTLKSGTTIRGTLTIGIGHIGKVDGKPIVWSTKITKEKAYAIFKNDIGSRVSQLNNMLKVTVTQNMFDALLSYAYNCGFSNQHMTKALYYINNGDFRRAALELKNGTNTSKGIVLGGLTRRREAEYQLFSKNMQYKVITLKDGVRLREKPSQSTEILKKYKKDTKLTITEIRTVLDRKYGKVKGTDNWVRMKYVKII